MMENMDVQGLNGFLAPRKEKIKRCPKCSSVYLTDSECEACGYQLNFDFIGEPFGYLSFYNARERFHVTGTLRKVAYFFRGKKDKRYVKYELTLKRRFSNLLIYFFEHIDVSSERRKFFFFELGELVEEMKTLGLSKYISGEVKDKIMSSDVENFSHNSIYVSKITSWINHNDIYSNKKDSLMGMKLFGAIRIGFIATSIFVTFALLAFGMILYPYFL